MRESYVDSASCMQIIGCLFNNPSLLDNEGYFFNQDDFTQEFHKIIFGTIYNLHMTGAEHITTASIESYLENRPEKYAVYKLNNGTEYLERLKNLAQESSFDYAYKRMKKMTLFRMYKKRINLDLSWLYDADNITDIVKKQKQEEWLDNTSIEDIAKLIDDKIEKIKEDYLTNEDLDFCSVGDGLSELIEDLKLHPEVGYPMYGDIMNAVSRGARLGKLYLVSAATGVGKTRHMISDACMIGCDEVFENGEWRSTGVAEPVLYITTEQQVDEIQTMMLAFISNVPEQHMLNNAYEDGDIEKITRAIAILKRSKIIIKRLPDFGLQDIEVIIKAAIREYGVKYFFHDYIHTSIKILSEVSSKANVKGLREDNILFMIAVRLKDLCTQNGIFIETSTQLNGDYASATHFDQNLLRGAKSIADKVDLGEIMLDVTQEDIESLQPIIDQVGLPPIDTKIAVYKNRRGQYKDILIWCESDKSTCRIKPVFVTNYKFEMVPITGLHIDVRERKSVF